MNNNTTIYQEGEISYAVGQRWINTDTHVECWITGIDGMTVSLDDKKGKLSSFEHMNLKLWSHLVNIGVYQIIM